MLNSYEKRFQEAHILIHSEELKWKARFPQTNTFERKRKLPLPDMILSALAKKGLTTVMELYHFFQRKGTSEMILSKQAYLQQRKRLNYNVFSFLNTQYLKHFYASKEPVLWNNYAVFAVDGTKAEVPDSKENRQVFHESKNNTNQSVVRALVSGLYDLFNDFFLDIQIASICTSESELSKQNLAILEEMLPSTPKLIVFDRGYPSIELVHFLEKKGIFYLFRLSSNDYIKERNSMQQKDEWVLLEHTSSRLQKIKKNHPDVIQELKTKKYTKTRMITFSLGDSEDVTLMTNLPSSIPKKEIIKVYQKRWGIETKYHTLKNKIKFESITGKASIYVYQDFWSQIYVYNMIQDVLHATNQVVKRKKEIRKHPVQVNENITIGFFKEKMIKILLESNSKVQRRLLIRLQKRIQKHVVPIRILPSKPRQHKPSNKYKNNQKNSF